MPTRTGSNTRTFTGYVISLLEYPRWHIEREVDFTDCPLSAGFDADDQRCQVCHFGSACRWLHRDSDMPTSDASLEDLLQVLNTAVEYLRAAGQAAPAHPGQCDCDTCEWLREATGFLRTHRYRK